MAGRDWRLIGGAIVGACKRFSLDARIRSVPHGVARRRGRHWSGTMEASTFGDGSRCNPIGHRCSRAVAAAAILFASSMSVASVHALAGVSSTSECIGTMTLSFTSAPLTVLPAQLTFSVSGNASCTGLGATSISWGSSNILSTEAACEGILAVGSGTVSWGNTTVTMAFAGPTAAEGWASVTLTGNSLLATGSFAWLDTGQIAACLTGGTSTVTLTGAFVIVT